jgi:hypothetical protein
MAFHVSPAWPIWVMPGKLCGIVALAPVSNPSGNSTDDGNSRRERDASPVKVGGVDSQLFLRRV